MAASYSKPRTPANTGGRTITATERTREILRRVSFARNCPIRAILEEQIELLVDEANMPGQGALPEPSYVHGLD